VTYAIELSRLAQKALHPLPKADLRKIRIKIDGLKEKPRPIGCEKLEGEYDLYRIRSGDYRIVYQILEKKLVILIIKIGHRRDIYRSL
jgi:mRNA interferase RelE/StbE